MSNTLQSVGHFARHFQNMTNELRALGLPPLGPDFLKLDGDSAVNALVVHRLLKKFEEPTKSGTRAATSVAAMLEYDQNLLTSFEPARMNMDPFVRRVLYNARGKLHEVLSSFRLSYNDLEIPDGESFDSSQGDNSVFSKLRRKRNWKVTPECASLFIRIVYNTLFLKRAAKAHMPKFSRTQEGFLFRYFSAKLKGSSKQQIGYAIFEWKLRKYVLTIWYGARVATVPKDSEKDRVIQVECFGNMICQRIIALALRRCIDNAFNIDLLHAQDLHKAMIADLSNATIDWKNASNSNALALINWFFPTRVQKLLVSTRSPVVSYYNGAEHEYHGLNMLSPMGNGYTFEVMTLFLLCIARELDDFAMVFGDDVIIHADCAVSYITCLETCGWVVNETKSFIEGPFRESCGGFYHTDIGYITSFDFNWPVDHTDCMILCNKLFKILEKDQVSGQVQSIIRSYWNEAIKFWPATAVRPSFQEFDLSTQGRPKPSFLLSVTLDQGVLVTMTKFKNLTRSCPVAKKMYELYKSRIKPAHGVEFVTAIRFPIKGTDTYRKVPVHKVRSIFWISQFMYTLRTDRPKRSNKQVSLWRTYILTKNGNLLPHNLWSVNFGVAGSRPARKLSFLPNASASLVTVKHIACSLE